MSDEAREPEARWRRIAALFDELVELPDPARRSRLDRVAAAEPDVARTVARLILADREADGLLDAPLTLSPLAVDGEPVDADEPTPARAGAYRIVGRLGRGGMAEVFAGARDDGVIEQRVAIKVLRRGLDTDDLLARFARERAILARLEHPAISRLLDAGALADGRPFLVMERVDGEPIDHYAAARALSLEARLRLLLLACDAVAFAHRNLVVHRDLKPSNVLVTAGGELKLLDFGIAKLVAPDDAPAGQPTRFELRALTPAYAAPEQVAGATTTTATDVWGLGALAFALLVGEPPFADAARSGDARSGTAPALRPSARLLEHAGRRGAEGRRAAARVAGDLDVVVGKALRLDPAERYSSAEAFADDLRRHLSGRPVSARAPSPGYRVAKFVGRHRGGVAAALLVLASLLIGGGTALWQARAAARERARPLPAVRYLTYSGHDAAPAASPDGRDVAFRSFRDGRSRIWLVGLASGDERPLTAGRDDHPRFSPDGAEILFTRSDATTSALYAVPRGGGEPRRLYDDVLFGDFSPAGDRVAFARQRAGGDGVETILVLGSRAGGEERELARLGGRALQPPRFSPDGRTIALTASSLGIGGRAAVALVDVATGRIRLLSVAASSPRGLAWSRSLRLVYSQPDTELGWITGESSRVVAQDWKSGATRSVLKSPTSVSALDVVGPGRVVYTSGSFRVNLREIDLGADAGASAERWLTRGDSSDRQPSFSPDGRSIVFSSNRGGNLDLWVADVATGAARRVTHDPAFDWDPAFTSDGKLLWSSNRGGSFEIWRAEADGSGAVELTHAGGDSENPSASADGRTVVYVSRDPSRRGIHRMRADGSADTLLVAGDLYLPELSPDGRAVAYLDLGGERPVLRLAATADGAPLDFALPLPLSDPGADPDPGRCRWFPDGRSLAVLNRDADGAYVVERHFLAPRPGEPRPPPTLLAKEPGHAAESFGLSPDGHHLLVAFWDASSNLMLADDVPGIER